MPIRIRNAAHQPNPSAEESRRLHTEMNTFLNALASWAAEQTDILAIAIVGSHARGAAKPDSDLDVVMIVDKPAAYLETSIWPEHFGPTCSISHEDWGLLKSKRVHYATGMDVEFGIAPPGWASIDPIDAGTRKVVLDGIRILYDPAGLLNSLVRSVTALTIREE